MSTSSSRSTPPTGPADLERLDDARFIDDVGPGLPPRRGVVTVPGVAIDVAAAAADGVADAAVTAAGSTGASNAFHRDSHSSDCGDTALATTATVGVTPLVVWNGTSDSTSVVAGS
jgi:hypothetical protein